MNSASYDLCLSRVVHVGIDYPALVWCICVAPTATWEGWWCMTPAWFFDPWEFML
jgi:hypothetical protein